MADVNAWFPPGLAQGDRDALLEAYPGDPHAAAADAWFDYAAGLEITGAGAEVKSVSTGVQTVTYSDAGGSPHDAAVARGDWHLSRAHAKTVKISGTVATVPFGEVTEEVDDLAYDEDDWDHGTIETAYFPPVGG